MKYYMLFVAQSYRFYADIYSLEYSGILYMFSYPILVSMASLLTSCKSKFMQNIPFNGAGRRPAPHPLLAIIPFPTAIYLYFIQSALCRICMYCCYTRICSHSWDVKRKYLFNMRGWAGPAPCPLPPLRWRSRRGGGGGGLAGHVLPGDFERGRGDLWQASRELKWQVFLANNSADYSRGWIRQFFTARYFGGSFWHIYLAGFHKQWKSKLLSKEEKEKRNV